MPPLPQHIQHLGQRTPLWATRDGRAVPGGPPAEGAKITAVWRPSDSAWACRSTPCAGLLLVFSLSLQVEVITVQLGASGRISCAHSFPPSTHSHIHSATPLKDHFIYWINLLHCNFYVWIWLLLHFPSFVMHKSRIVTVASAHQGLQEGAGRANNGFDSKPKTNLHRLIWQLWCLLNLTHSQHEH